MIGLGFGARRRLVAIDLPDLLDQPGIVIARRRRNSRCGRPAPRRATSFSSSQAPMVSISRRRSCRSSSDLAARDLRRDAVEQPLQRRRSASRSRPARMQFERIAVGRPHSALARSSRLLPIRSSTPAFDAPLQFAGRSTRSLSSRQLASRNAIDANQLSHPERCVSFAPNGRQDRSDDQGLSVRHPQHFVARRASARSGSSSRASPVIRKANRRSPM